MSHEAMTWAMYHAPRLMTKAGNPDSTARTVLFVMAENAGADGSDSFPGPDLIDDVTGFDESTIRRALRRLESAKLIERAGKRPSGAIVWRLNMVLKREVSHREVRAAKKQSRRAAGAERTRRYRAAEARKKDEAAGDVTVTAPVTSSSDEAGVTGAVTVTPGVAAGDVTGAAPSRDGRSARDVTGAVPPDPVTEPPGGIGGAAARPQTPAVSTPGSGSVGGSTTAQVDQETCAPYAYEPAREEQPTVHRRLGLCAHGKPLGSLPNGLPDCARCRRLGSPEARPQLRVVGGDE